MNMHTLAWLRKSVLLVVLLPVLTASAPKKGKGITFFEGTWAEVLAEAAAAGKPIWVDVAAAWCGPCRLMEKTIFKHEAPGAFYNQNFICYHLDADTKEGKEVADKYRVSLIPAYLFMDSKGIIFHRAEGGMTEEEFLTMGRTAAAKWASRAK